MFEADGKDWKRQTINTFLQRLENKGMVRRENGLVEPLYDREEYVSIQVKALINRIYRGKLSDYDKEALADELYYAIQDCEPES